MVQFRRCRLKRLWLSELRRHIFLTAELWKGGTFPPWRDSLFERTPLTAAKFGSGTYGIAKISRPPAGVARSANIISLA